MKTYKGWQILEDIPDGWSIDKTAGAPGKYVFVTNGKSVLNGQKRALILVRNPQVDMFAHEVPRIELKLELPKAVSNSDKQGKHFDAPYARTVNELAREKFKSGSFMTFSAIYRFARLKAGPSLNTLIR